ncbi:uncharacterized protein [Porites lutea]|uniref:uncharacterized protein n=1 Tax=Porites lutea TaxID=51062 RepID=UPI003CC58B96
MYFVYPANTVHCAKCVTQELSLDDLSCFPRDFFFSSRAYQPHYKKILLLNRGEKLPYGITLEEYHNCCRETVTEYFFANVSLDQQNACTPGWLNLGESCFQIYSYNYQTSKDAMFKCHNLGGRRAVLGNAVQLHALSRFIDDYIGDPWLNSDHLWPCQWYLSCGFICETDERRFLIGWQSVHSSQANSSGEPFHAVDGNVASCFTVKRQKGQPVWWTVTLQRRGFVSKIWIINRLGRCLAEMPKHDVILRNNVETKKANCKVYSWKDRQKTLMICEPLISASNVTIYEDGVDDLSLCEVMITAIESEDSLHGVLQELWYDNPFAVSLQDDSSFPSNPNVVYILRQFDAPFDFHTFYGQRLTAYLQVSESGNYTFFVACDDTCELWLRTEKEEHVEKMADNEASGKLLLIKLDYWTDRNQWNKFPSQQTSKEIWLSKCQSYSLELLMRQFGGKDGASVGMKLPNGTFIGPITEDHLFWVRPGVGYIDFQISSVPKKVTLKTGQKLLIQDYVMLSAETTRGTKREAAEGDTKYDVKVPKPEAVDPVTEPTDEYAGGPDPLYVADFKKLRPAKRWKKNTLVNQKFIITLDQNSGPREGEDLNISATHALAVAMDNPMTISGHFKMAAESIEKKDD